MKQNLTNLSSPYISSPTISQTQGILPSQIIREYVKNGFISASEPIEESQFQPASIDLRLGPVAYELCASFLPGDHSDISTKLDELQLCRRKLDLTDSVILQPNKVYLVELMESLRLPPTVWGRANPRSTTGRADLFTRLLCDFSTEFEGVPLGYAGKLYAEIVPHTFAVRVRKGTRVNQIRLIIENSLPSNNGIIINSSSSSSKEHGPVPGSIYKELLSVDLTPESESGVIGYRAKRNAPVLDFDCVACHHPLEFWDPIILGQLGNVILDPDDFFILKSLEKVSIPPSLAAELTPYDPSFGEFRVHYAGFLDPGFGYSQDRNSGTPVVLEVRTRDVRFLIEHGQKMAWVLYYQLQAETNKIYGARIGSSYHAQGIALGKQFKR